MKVLVYILIALLVVALIVTGVMLLIQLNEKTEEKIYQLEYSDIVFKYSEEYGVPPEIVYAVIECESNFKPDALSKSGAMGLMQIMPATFKDIQGRIHEEYEDDMLYDPEVNIKCGTFYLSYLYKYFGDWDLVYAAYNAGMGNVSKWLANDEYSKDGKLINIPFPETDRYVKKVKNAVQQYEIKLYKSEEEK